MFRRAIPPGPLSVWSLTHGGCLDGHNVEAEEYEAVRVCDLEAKTVITPNRRAACAKVIGEECPCRLACGIMVGELGAGGVEAMCSVAQMKEVARHHLRTIESGRNPRLERPLQPKASEKSYFSSS